jgi:outer membrane protein assembly factor BamE (lipoprotein component of BamABCDE complex)
VKKTLLLVAVAVVLVGCVTPSQTVGGLRLGMTPQEVYEVMGAPFAVRAAKTYEDGTTSQVWEYVPPVFSRAAFSDKYDKTYWVFFVNDKVVQWGEPGDFSKHDTTKDVTVKDYVQEKVR